MGIYQIRSAYYRQKEGIMRHHNHKLTVLAAFVVLSGCSSITEEEHFANTPVETLYIEAKNYLDEGSLTKAAAAFAEVERQHPYSSWALKAQLMAAYAQYLGKKYDESIEGFKTFIMLHPGHEHVGYAYYMIGLCYYEQMPTVQRDQEVTLNAQQAFEEVCRRFPQSAFGKDARFKLDLIDDHLAGKEMDIGRYYLQKKSYLAAVNRFKIVVERHQRTSHITEALHRLVECYLGLGVLDQAKASAAVLGHNYPGSTWYADSYQLLKTTVPDMVSPDKQGAVGPEMVVTPPQNEPETTPPTA